MSFAVPDGVHPDGRHVGFDVRNGGLDQPAQYVGRRIAALVRCKPGGAPFIYRHFGELAAIGRRSAIVNLPYLRLTGFVGWLFWSVAHIYFLIGARNRAIVAFSWLWSYLTFQRGARLIS